MKQQGKRAWMFDVVMNMTREQEPTGAITNELRKRLKTTEYDPQWLSTVGEVPLDIGVRFVRRVVEETDSLEARFKQSGITYAESKRLVNLMHRWVELNPELAEEAGINPEDYEPDESGEKLTPIPPASVILSMALMYMGVNDDPEKSLKREITRRKDGDHAEETDQG